MLVGLLQVSIRALIYRAAYLNEPRAAYSSELLGW